MKSIPTMYNGVSFRSRLEARYACSFDSIGLEWAYEVEGLQLVSGERYLPDFWLPKLNAFIEVKGPLKDRLHLVHAAALQSEDFSFFVGDECGRLTRAIFIGVCHIPGCIACGACFAKCAKCNGLFLEHRGLKACPHCGRCGENWLQYVKWRLPQMQWRPR